MLPVALDVTVLVWLDSGADYDPALGFSSAEQMKSPWSVQPPRSHYLPIVIHKHMIALKWHLSVPAQAGQSDTQPAARGASHLPIDYGRSLRPATMAQDALYALTEVFTLAISSQSQFLNLIAAKLDGCASANMPPESNWESLPNLRYTEQVLNRYTNATRQALNSIRSASTHPKWPHDTTESGRRKAAAAAENVVRDFEHLLGRAEVLDRRATEAISVLMSSISILESQRAIQQAEKMGKLTFLAFLFIPLSFTSSFFGMNVTMLKNDVDLKWWVVFSIPVLVGSFALYYWDIERRLKQVNAFLWGV
jgi:hypothetical protein